MKSLEYNGHVSEDGLLHIHNRARFIEEVKGFTGKEVEIIVQRKRRLRSIPLNRYYWGVVVKMLRDRLEELGHEVSLEIVHDFLKSRFNYKEFVNEKTGEVFALPQTTTQMTNTEFMMYMEKVKVFAASVLDLSIPDPNEQVRLEL